MLINFVDFPETTLTENDHSLICNAFKLTEETYLQLVELSKVLTDAKIGIISVETEFGTPIDISEPLDPINHAVQAQFAITKISNYPVFFTLPAFESHLKISIFLGDMYGLLFSDYDFRTVSTTFYGLSSVMANGFSRSTVVANNDSVSKYVKSINEKAIQFLPDKAFQWLSVDIGLLPNYWKKSCAPKLFCTLATEVSIEADMIVATFRGDRRINVFMPLTDEKSLVNNFASIHKIAEWIYSEGRDIETRHILFNNQVCLLSSSDIELLQTNFIQTAERLLESSMLAYRYYLQNSSKELNRSLTEINRMLFEHINKIRQNTVDLVNGLWRDFTTAFGLMILNISLKKPDISDAYWKWILIGLIIYLAVSFYLGSSVGFWFYGRLRVSLVEMRSRIYGYLTDDDFRTYAVQPLKAAQEKYKQTFWWVLVCYCLMIFLVWTSIKFFDGNNNSVTLILPATLRGMATIHTSKV